jgi:SsrA-binding protein
MSKDSIKIIANNKKAYHEYFILEKFEAGVELFGTEVKSVRKGAVSLREAFCFFEGGEIFVRQMHISPYEQGNIFNKDPLRPKKLLMHKREIRKLFEAQKIGGNTIIPTSVYLKGPYVKVEVAIAKGKKLYDKRDAAQKADSKREIDRSMKEARRRTD